MRTKIRVNPAYTGVEDFMKSLPTTFNDRGVTLKNDRNEIKIIQHGELKLCVKSFNKVTVFNRYMYSWFRSTKAKRSYKIALRLKKKTLIRLPPSAMLKCMVIGVFCKKPFMSLCIWSMIMIWQIY